MIQRGFKPEYWEKLDDGQKKFLMTPCGLLFWNGFIKIKGTHLFIVGNTGSGKTKKAVWAVSWLKNTETIVWISSGKNDEVLDLFTLGKPVRIIVPKGAHLQFRKAGRTFEVEEIDVTEPGTAWWAVKKGYINIFEFRNTIRDKHQRLIWMGELFQSLADWTREKKMPHIFPCTIVADETQWFLAGTRISRDSTRAAVSEIVTENALEIRGAGGRLVFITQSYSNITPAARENLQATILCRGAFVSKDDSPALNRFNSHVGYYKNYEGLFVRPDGIACPGNRPWHFPNFPKKDACRKCISNIKINYEGEYQIPREILTEETELIPNFGRWTGIEDALLAEPPLSRWEAPVFIEVEDDVL